MKILALLASLQLAALPASAAPSVGYVVKVDGARVFLDFGAASGAAAGQAFTVFAEGDSLKHPVTGEDLGREERTLASGRIVEVHDKYSLGEVAAPPAGLAAGQKARLGAAAPPPAAAEPAPAGPSAGRKPYLRSPSLDLEAVDVASADVDGLGARQVVSAGKDSVLAYPVRTEGAWTPSCSFKDDSTGVQFLSLEAADLDGDKKAEVFATVHNRFFNRIETYVLACANGRFEKKAALPWVVRGHSAPDGSWKLAVQQFLPDSTFPLSDIYPLQYADGRWGPGTEKIRHKRVEWAYGFGLATQDGQEFPIFLTKTNRIRLQFAKGSWISPEPFGQTANRVRWKDKPFQFHPRLLLEPGATALSGLAVLKNIARFGTLAEPMGVYARSELHHMRFNGVSLEPDWSAEIGGYAAGLAREPSGDLVVTVLGGSGRTSLWFFKP